MQDIPLTPLLSKEERKVLVLSAVHPNGKHLGISEIGKRLGMSVTCVKTHIHQACVKLGAVNRNEAVLIAMKRREINVDELLTLEELADILRSVNPDVLRMVADAVRNNQVRIPFQSEDERFIRKDIRKPGVLTNRERDVLILSSNGMTNGEIADQLCMTTSAVRTFLNRAFTKLGACKKADAIQMALKLAEISVGEISSLDELAYYLMPLGADSIEKIANYIETKYGKEAVLTGVIGSVIK